MRRISSVMSALTVSTLYLANCVQAADFQADGINYSIISYSESTVRVDAADAETGYEGMVMIPPVVSDGEFEYTVVQVGEMAFFGSYELKRVELPPTIRLIDDSAFRSCLQLEYVYLSEGVETIAESAFADCWELRRINFPSTLEYIGSMAFSKCKLTSVALPAGLRHLGSNAFAENSDLEEITMPEALESMGSNVFALTKWYDAQPRGMIYLEPGIAYQQKGTLTASESEVELAEGTRLIAGSCFSNQTRLKNVALPESLRIICDGAFGGCINLENPEFNEGLESIGVQAYNKCQAMTEVNLPSSVRKIGDYCFFDSAVAEFSIGEGIEEVGVDILRQTPWLAAQPAGVVYLNDYVVYGALGEMPAGTTIAVREGVRVICPRAFAGNMGLSYVTLPETLVTIGAAAFEYTGLEEVEIPDGVRYLGEGAFGECGRLRRVSLGAGLEEMGAIPFSGCYVLEEVKSYNPVPPSVPYYSSRIIPTSVMETAVLRVPEGSRGAYEEAPGWQDFFIIVEGFSGVEELTGTAGEAQAGGVYDLQGRRIGNTLTERELPRGIYIYKGKKILK